MVPDELEITLHSENEHIDWDYNVDLQIHAVTKDTDYFEKNTVIFDCDPVGSNCQRTYLEVVFTERSALKEIHQFLSSHLEQNDNKERVKEVSLSDGTWINDWASERRDKSENLESIYIIATPDTIHFGSRGRMCPNIRIYETATEDGPQDRRNGERLLSFFDEIAEETDQPSHLDLHDGELIDRCLPLYEQGSYPETARTAGQILEERVGEKSPSSMDSFEGTDLLRRSLSPDNGPLRVAENEGEQQGVMELFVGVYLAIRNPLSHRSPNPDNNRYLDDLGRTQTKKILHLTDFLLTLLSRYHD